MATDGEETYVLFLYRDIQWGNRFSAAGFGRGDGSNGVPLPGDDFTLDSRSNVGPDFPGVWMFRVDQYQIILPSQGIIMSSVLWFGMNALLYRTITSDRCVSCC